MIEKTGDDLVVIAADPNELAEGQVALIGRVSEKLTEAEEELQSAVALRESCEAFNLGPEKAKRLEARAKSRVLYLSKIREALAAGFVIVPSFPSRTIAIRVKRSLPRGKTQSSNYAEPSLCKEQPDILPVGEGRYVDNRPLGRKHNWIETKDGKEIKHYDAWPTGFDSNFDWPVDFLKPTVVQMTGKVLARKIFDEITVVDNVGVDPMVIGRIMDRRSGRSINFLVAWFVDTKDI